MSEQRDHQAASGTPPAGLNGVPEPTTLSDRVRSLRLPSQAAAARPARGSWLPWALCAVLGAAAVYFAYLDYSRPQSSEETTAGNTATASPGGSAGAPTASSGDVVLESKGYIVPIHQIQVSPKVGGMVEKLYIEEGKRVKKGQILAQLETVDYLANYNNAVYLSESAKQRYLELKNGSRPEEIESAKAELNEAEAQREQLYLDWKRSNSLKIGTAMAARDYEQAYSSYKAMDRRVERLKQAYRLMVLGPRKERVAAAKGEWDQAEANLRKAKWTLDNCTIVAPISGIILTKKAEEGNIVNPIAFNISASLCEMADLTELEVDMNIQERDVAKVYQGQHCKVRPEAFAEREYDAIVSRLMPQADRAKGAVPVRVKIKVPKEEEGIYLKPEMGAVVSFLKKK